MNQVYNKLRTKRKYTRRPFCPNKEGLCTFDKCRCDIMIRIPKKKDSRILHYPLEKKVIERKEEILKAKVDIDNRNLWDDEFIEEIHDWYRGEYYKQRWKRNLWSRIKILLRIK